MSFRIPLFPLKVRLITIIVLVAVMSFLSRHFLLDDALIYARYIQHALDGHGLVFNDGEPINALTSILDTWLVLGFSLLLHGHVLLVESSLSAIFLVLAAGMAEEMVPFSGILLTAMPFLYLCKGMETSLFLLILMLCVRVWCADRINWLPLLCLLAVLTRFEGGALLVVIMWRLWQTRRMPHLLSFLAPTVIGALYVGFNLSFYHRILPQSASAKLGQGMSGFWGKWPTAFLGVPELVTYPLGAPAVFFVLVAVLAWYASRDPRMSRLNQIVLPFLIILTSFYVLFNIPGYHWYYAPLVYFLLLYAARLIPDRPDARLATVLVLLAIFRVSGLYLHRRDILPEPYDQAALWLDKNTPRDARIASVETGHIGWNCNRYIIDIVGLTSPQNAFYTAHRDFSSWLNARPDVIIVHPDNPFPWERVALRSPDYEYLPVHFGNVYLLRRK
jgi:arabinofuranosyltransferase